MRIVYVARPYDPKSNDDEGAVQHALTRLGHDVFRVDEAVADRGDLPPGDVLLFNKWHNPAVLASLRGRYVRASWYWDLVEYPRDRTLARRNATRLAWMTAVLPHVDVGFCTDGDWVRRWNSGGVGPKLHRLNQGADGRVAGAAPAPPAGQDIDVLCVASTVRCGVGRLSFVHFLQGKLGHRFVHVEDGVWGRKLAETVARARVVVAPDHPLTADYWSVRVYTMLGYGAFLLHPYSAGLCREYTDRTHLYLYYSRDHLCDLAEDLCQPAHADHRRAVAAAGYDHTAAHHTYLSRCAELCHHLSNLVPEGVT